MWSTDPVYTAAVTAHQQGGQLPNFSQLAVQGTDFFNIYYNLANHLTLIQANDPRVVANGEILPVYRQALQEWTNFVNAAISAAPAQSPLLQDPDSAAFVRSLYVSLFGREPDQSGWEFWTLELINGRKTRAEVQAAFAADSEAVAYAAAQAQQNNAAQIAQLQQQLANAQAALAAATSSGSSAAQVAELQQQLAAAEAALAAATGTTTTPGAEDEGYFSGVMSWVQENLWLSLGIGAAAFFLLSDSGGKKR